MKKEFDAAWYKIINVVKKTLKQPQLVDECYSISLFIAYKASLRLDIKDTMGYYVTLILSQANKLYRKERSKNLIFLEDMVTSQNDGGWDEFVDSHFQTENPEDAIKRERLHQKLDNALITLTTIQRTALLGDRSIRGKGRKSCTTTNNRKQALASIRTFMGVGLKTPLTEKQKFYLNINKMYEGGDIPNIKNYLKTNGLSYPTYFIMVKNAKNKLLQTKKEDI